MLWIVIIYAKSGQLKSLNHRKSCDLYGWHALRGRSLSPGQRPGLFRMQTCRPVRAKALKLQGQLVKLLPLQGVLPIAIIPRALPWAKSFCPFRACQPYRSCFFADIDIFADGVFYYICRKKQLSRTGWRCKCLAVFLKFCPRLIKVLGQNLIKNKEKRGKCLVI